MENPDVLSEIKENKAKIKMLNSRLDALVTVLAKEGITTVDEVDAATREIIEKRQ